MVYQSSVEVTCDVCRDRQITFRGTFLNKSVVKMRLKSREWKFSKGPVPYTGFDGKTYHRDGERVVCPSCFSKGLHR